MLRQKRLNKTNLITTLKTDQGKILRHTEAMNFNFQLNLLSQIVGTAYTMIHSVMSGCATLYTGESGNHMRPKGSPSLTVLPKWLTLNTSLNL